MPPVATPYSTAASVVPVMRTASAMIDTNWNTAGDASTYDPQYNQDTAAPSYQQSSYPYGDRYPQKSSSSSSQQPFYQDQTWPSSYSPFSQTSLSQKLMKFYPQATQTTRPTTLHLHHKATTTLGRVHEDLKVHLILVGSWNFLQRKETRS